MQQSTGSLIDESYDMVDDVSSISSDDHETVSIASTEQIDDHADIDHIASVLDDMQSLPVHECQHVCALCDLDIPQPLEESTFDADPTPKQSVLVAEPSYEYTKPIQQTQPAIMSWIDGHPFLSVAAIVVAGVLAQILILLQLHPDRTKQVLDDYKIQQARLHELSPNLNISHLVPYPAITGKSWLGRDLYCTSEVRYQADGNDVIIATPRIDTFDFCELKALTVVRGPQSLSANTTQLIHGIYAVTIPASEAFGLVTYTFSCHRPKLDVVITHDFGRPVMHAVRALAERVAKTTHLIDQAAASAQKIEERTKNLASDLIVHAASGAHVLEQQTREIAQGFEQHAASLASSLLSRAAVQIQHIERQTKELAVRAHGELTRELHLSRQRAQKIASDLRTRTKKTQRRARRSKAKRHKQ